VSLTDAVLQRLPDEVRRTLRAYAADVARLFGPALEGILLYGSAARGVFLPGRSNLNLMVLLSDHDRDALERYARGHRRWQREGIVVPLFLTPTDLRKAAGCFPLELLDIRDAHVLLKGRDPFPELRVNPANLRSQCEQEIHGNLLRLRQRFVEGGGKPEAAAILMPLSITALLPALRGLLRLLGLKVPMASDEVLADLGKGLGLDTGGFQEVLALKRGLISPGPLELPRLFDRYHAALESLAAGLDQLDKVPPT
jgi:predicted nucleotidyltransferase